MAWNRYGNKYRNKKIETADGVFDSKKEFNRWCELRMLERTGAIQHLYRQVPFELIPTQYIDGKCVERSCKYIADFVYEEHGKTVVEDAKGFRTADYNIKRKLMLHVHGIRVKEI